MILDPGYKTEAFEQLACMPDILKKRQAASEPVSLETSWFTDMFWAKYQKSIQEYGIDPEEAAFDAFEETLQSLAKRGGSILSI